MRWNVRAPVKRGVDIKKSKLRAPGGCNSGASRCIIHNAFLRCSVRCTAQKHANCCSSVRFSLQDYPLSQNVQDADTTTGTGASPAGGRSLVVVIDQDQTSASYLVASLNPESAEVVHVASARDGFQGIKARMPSAVLICAEVPNGIATCNKLKRDAKLKDIPVVLMSEAWDGKVLALHRSLPTRADFYADKPLDESLMTLPVFAKLMRGKKGGQQSIPPAPAAPPTL